MTEEQDTYCEEFEPTAIRLPSSGGKSFAQIQRDADKAVEKNTARFVKYLAKDLTDIEKMLKVYLQEPSRKNMRPIFDRIHNLRGQGTMFGYPLVTTIGGHFCRYVDSLPEDSLPRKDVVATFVKSLRVVQTQSIKGNGSERFQMLIKNMAQMVDQLTKE